jgi:O-antigen ligase
MTAGTRVLATAFLLTVLIVMTVSARAAPFLLAGLLLLVLGLEVSASRSPHQVRWQTLPAGVLTSPLVVALLLLCLWAAVRSTWAPVRFSGLINIALAAIITCGVAVIVASLERKPRSALERSAFWIAAGIMIGGAFLAIELSTDLVIKRTVLAAFPILIPQSRKFVQVDGTVITISTEDPNRSILFACLLLWPAALFLANRYIGMRRVLAVASLLILVVYPTMISRHDASRLALITSGIVLLLTLWKPRVGRATLVAGWSLAVLAILPLAIAAYEFDLYRLKAVPTSGQDRIVIWDFTARETLKSPLSGVGPRTTYLKGQSTFDAAERVAGTPYRRWTSIHSHNVYLQTWYELGLIGALLLWAAGIAAIRAIATLPDRTQPTAAALFAVFATEIGLTYDMWQTWFLAVFGVAVVAFAIACRIGSGSDTDVMIGSREPASAASTSP